MSYKKYIKRGRKIYGPYIYHSRKVNGKVTTEYLGKGKEKTNKKILPLFLSIVIILLLLFLILLPKYYEKINFVQSLNNFKNLLTGFSISENLENENQQTEIIIPENVTIIPETAGNETISGENITQQETINQTSGINEKQTISNKTTIWGQNETINETQVIVPEENTTIQIIQYQAVLNQPVRWKKQISPNRERNLTIKLPKEAENIIINKLKGENKERIVTSITGAVSSEFFARMFAFLGLTGRAIDEAVEEKEIEVELEIENTTSEIEVEYETPAPYAIENEKERGKEVRIIGIESVHYENVLSFTNLNENLKIKNPSLVKIYWKEQDSFVPIEKIEDRNNNGIYDYVEWIAPILSNQTFDIIIEISKAEHLDANRQFFSDIYNEVKTRDNIWSESINDNEYVRVTFNQPLDSSRDITLYLRVISGNPTIEVYEKDRNDKIAEFTNIKSNEYNKVFLTNLQNSQDTFDLKVSGGSIEIDYIVDPSILRTYYLWRPLINNRTFNLTAPSGTRYANYTLRSGNVTAGTNMGWNWTSANAYSGNIVLSNWTAADVVIFCNSSKVGAARRANITKVYLYDCGTSPNCTGGSVIWQNTSLGMPVGLPTGSATGGNCNATAPAHNITVRLRGPNYTISAGEYLGIGIYVFAKNATVNVLLNSTAMPTRFNISEGDELSPAITILYPSNNSNWTAVNIDVNYTINDAGTGIESCWYSNDSGKNNNTLTNCANITGVTWLEGINNVTIWVNDTFNNLNWTSVRFTIDTTNPNINITYPINNSNWNINTIDVNYTASDTGIGLFNCWYSNDSYLKNTSLANCGTNITEVIWIEGTHRVTIWANDSLGNINKSTINFTIDTINPNINITYPINNTNTSNIQINVNYTINDAGTGIESCWYSNDSGKNNNTLTNCANITGVTWLEGINNVTIWVNDSVGNLNLSRVTFMVDTTPPYFTNLENQSITTAQSLNYDINAADDGVGLETFAINWTNTFNINSGAGTLTNISGLSPGDYYINISINDTLNNLNSSILKVSVISADAVAPNITSLTETPSDPATYSSQVKYEFNATILDISAISRVLLEFNGMNYTASTTGNNVYNVTIQNLPAGTFNYRWFANDTYGNTNNTETGSYAINQNTTPCNIYFNETSPLTYGKKFLVLTNCSSPFSMYRNGTSTSNGSEQDLAVAIGYNFTVIRDDRSNYTNTAQEAAFTVSKATLTGSLSSTKGWSYTYDNLATTISYSETIAGDADVIYKVFRDNIDKSSGETVNLAVGNYNYKLNSTGGQNYSANANIDSQTLTIGKATPTGLISGTSPITYGTAGDITGSESNVGDGDINYKLFRNNVEVSNPDTSILAAGNYNYIYNTTGGTNYSASVSLDTFSLTVNKAIPQGSLTSSNGWTLNYGQGTIIGVSESNNGDGDLIYSTFRDSTNGGVGFINLSVGIYTYKLNTTGGTNYTINSSMNTQALTINQIASSINLTLGNVQGNTSINEDTSIDLNCSQILGDSGAILKLYNNGTLINQGSNPIGNTTTFNNPATYNITCIYAATTNFSQNSERWWLRVNDTTKPDIVVIYPLNNTNTSNIKIDVNYTISDISVLSSCWYSNNSGKNNNTLTNCANITGKTWLQGVNNVTIWANDTSNNVNSSGVTFTIDTTNPSINIISPQNNSNSSNINLDVNYTTSDSGIGLFNCWYSNDSYLKNTSLANCGTNITNIVWSEGTHKITIWTNDSVGNINRSTINFTIDTIKPNINVTYPINNTNTTNAQINVNYTINDAGTGVGSCWYSNNSGKNNNTLTNCANITGRTWIEGINNVAIWVNDTSGNQNSSSVRFRVDTTPPYFTNLANQTVSETNSLNYDIDAEDDGVGLGTFAINWTSNFSIVASTGILTNTSGLKLGVYWINVSVNDTLGNKHSGIFYMNVSEIIDFDYPQFSDFVSIPGNASIYTSGQIYRFNSTIIKTNGSVGLEFNGINYSATNLSEVFSAEISDLAGGTYAYRWWAFGNGTLKNFNKTSTMYYTINKSSNIAMTKYLNGIDNNITIIYPKQLNATAVSTQGTINIYRDGADATSENGLNVSLSAGYYEYEFNVTGNSNYTDIAGEFLYANITKANGLAYLYINGTRSNFSSERLPTTKDIWLNATLISGTGNIELWVNGTLYNNGTSPQANLTNLSQGFYNITSKYYGNENYTSNEEVYWVNVTLNTPSLEILSPRNETYPENTSLLLNYSASSSIGIDSIWYNLNLGTNETITSKTYFNISAGSHTLYLYANNSNGITTRNVTFFVNLTLFEVTKNRWTGDTKGNSTNFNVYSYSEMQNLSNITLENTQFGKIYFNSPINLTDDANPNDNQIDLDEHVNISSNKIELNSTALPNLNKSATLYLYNLTFTDPRVLRNGQLCPDNICTKESYSSGILKFSVTHFTSYSAEEMPSVAGAEVSAGASTTGGGTGCDNNNDCKEDEVCWKKACIKLFDIKIMNFTSPAKLGEFFDFTYFVKGMANINDDVEINFWIEQGGKIVTSGSDVIYLGSFEEKTETTKIFLPTNIKSGIYEFYVEVVNQEYNVKSYRTIEIEVKEGIVKISSINTKKIGTYILISALILFVLILSIILHAERKNIKKLFIQEKTFIKKHKNSVLITLLFITFGVIIYYSGLFALIVGLISEMSLWFKINVLPYLLEVLLVVLASIGLITILIISRKKWFKHWKRKTGENLKKKARLFSRLIKKHKEEKELRKKREELARRREGRIKEKKREKEEFARKLAKRKKESIKRGQEKLKKEYRGLLNEKELALLKEIQSPKEKKGLSPKELALLKEIQSPKKEKKDL